MMVHVSSKGQIVLPAEVRRRWDIKAGDRLVLVDLGEHVSLVPVVDGDPVEVARGLLSGVAGASTRELHAERRRAAAREERGRGR